jgi:hypothetical protein
VPSTDSTIRLTPDRLPNWQGYGGGGIGRRAATLEREIEEAAALCRGAAWATDDPLGIGALLTSAYRLAAMIVDRGIEGGELLERIVAAAEVGLAAYARGEALAEPASRRLAFRELGLAIGLHALERIPALTAKAQRVPKRLARTWHAICLWLDESTTSGAPPATVRAPLGAPMATSTR